MKNPLNDYRIVILACLTLGLAPYFPEPHLLGKIRWVAGGAKGMMPMDWFDLVFHSLPWIALLRLVFLRVKPRS